MQAAGTMDLPHPLTIPSEYQEGWPWHLHVRHSDISPTPAGAVTSSGVIQPSGTCHQIIGWAFRETTNSAGADFRLWDGAGTGGEVIVAINLATNESTRDFHGPPGIWCVSGGIYLQMISGSIEGVIYWL